MCNTTIVPHPVAELLSSEHKQTTVNNNGMNLFS